MTPKFSYSEDQIRFLLDGIYAGTITEYAIPEQLYLSIADYLKAGLYKGFGGDLTKFVGKDLELLVELRQNVYMFSAAKSFQELKYINSLMFDEDGNLRSPKEFSKLGQQAFETWNEAWGLTERNTAEGQGQMASKWNEIEKNKDLLPILEYSAIGDACDICRPLDGLTAPVNDKVWFKITPLNHFNCECLLLQHEAGKALTPDKEKELIFKKVEMEMDDTFKMNAGKDRMVFSEKHPFFHVSKEDKEFAMNNFNLPLPNND